MTHKLLRPHTRNCVQRLAGPVRHSPTRCKSWVHLRALIDWSVPLQRLIGMLQMMVAIGTVVLVFQLYMKINKDDSDWFSKRCVHDTWPCWHIGRCALTNAGCMTK